MIYDVIKSRKYTVFKILLKGIPLEGFHLNLKRINYKKLTVRFSILHNATLSR